MTDTNFPRTNGAEDKQKARIDTEVKDRRKKAKNKSAYSRKAAKIAKEKGFTNDKCLIGVSHNIVDTCCTTRSSTLSIIPLKRALYKMSGTIRTFVKIVCFNELLPCPSEHLPGLGEKVFRRTFILFF